MSENFLARWSRRKNEARRAERSSTAEPDGAARLKPDVPPETRAAQPAITPEEFAALPKLDELTADSDIAGFLRRGVPEALRNAALRKMWMLDPAIRDFVGHARDYAYDWNTPGAVPGNGALQPEDAAVMLRRVFGEAKAAHSEGCAAAEPTGDRAAAVHSVSVGRAAVPQEEIAREAGKPTAGDDQTETGAAPGKDGVAASREG
jgi:hypothetical protein